MHHGVPTLVHGPPFQGVKYPADAPRAHHPSWQPVLSMNEINKIVLREASIGKNVSYIFFLFSSSNLVKWINYARYPCYLAGMDVLHGFRDLHCWSAQVGAILADFLDGEL
jgi:hypothetical protein